MSGSIAKFTPPKALAFFQPYQHTPFLQILKDHITPGETQKYEIPYLKQRGFQVAFLGGGAIAGIKQYRADKFVSYSRVQKANLPIFAALGLGYTLYLLNGAFRKDSKNNDGFRISKNYSFSRNAAIATGATLGSLGVSALFVAADPSKSFYTRSIAGQALGAIGGITGAIAGGFIYDVLTDPETWEVRSHFGYGQKLAQQHIAFRPQALKLV